MWCAGTGVAILTIHVILASGISLPESTVVSGSAAAQLLISDFYGISIHPSGLYALVVSITGSVKIFCMLFTHHQKLKNKKSFLHRVDLPGASYL